MGSWIDSIGRSCLALVVITIAAMGFGSSALATHDHAAAQHHSSHSSHDGADHQKHDHGPQDAGHSHLDHQRRAEGERRGQPGRATGTGAGTIQDHCDSLRVQSNHHLTDLCPITLKPFHCELCSNKAAVPAAIASQRDRKPPVLIAIQELLVRLEKNWSEPAIASSGWPAETERRRPFSRILALEHRLRI